MMYQINTENNSGSAKSLETISSERSLVFRPRLLPGPVCSFEDPLLLSNNPHRRPCLSRSSSISSTSSFLNDIKTFDGFDLKLFDRRVQPIIAGHKLTDLELDDDDDNGNVSSLSHRECCFPEETESMAKFLEDFLEGESQKTSALPSRDPSRMNASTESISKVLEDFFQGSAQAAPSVPAQDHFKIPERPSNKPIVAARTELQKEKRQTPPRSATVKRRPRGKKLSKLNASSAARKPRRIIPEIKDYILDEEPTDLDVVGGRGNVSNHHMGNRRYWSKILERRNQYKTLCCGRNAPEKNIIAESIVNDIESNNGRFLEREKPTGRYYVVPRQAILVKVKQALRDEYVPLWARSKEIQSMKAVYSNKRY